MTTPAAPLRPLIMRNTLRRLWPRRKPSAGATMAVQVRSVLVPRPIPVTERQPGPADLGGFDSNCCWWGHWQDDHWLWVWYYKPVRKYTHWLPASVEVLPARCCLPDVG